MDHRGHRPVIRASAPVRLDFAGGWTDVAPFALEEGGLVVNGAIELRAEAELVVAGSRYHLTSEDLDEAQSFGANDPLAANGTLSLLKAALRRARLGPATLTTRCRAPAGSGLGSSGALDVALVAATDRARGVVRTPAELAEEAFALESVEAGLPGGRQDQYAAALGGFHRLRFSRQGVTAERLHLDAGFLAELREHLVVCYTGVSRVSSRAIERVVHAYREGNARVVDALRALVAIAEAMSGAFGSESLPAIGRLLDENWLQQRRLDPSMSTPDMERLEAAMGGAGAFGGKAAGAGAGGSMFFVVPDRERAVRAAEAVGQRVLPMEWASRGVTVEEAG